MQLNREIEQEQSKKCILLIQNEDLTEFSLVNVRGMDKQELVATLSNMSEDDKLSIQVYLESKGAWTTELGNEKSREFEEYHLDVRYNFDTDEITDVKAKMTEQIDSNLSVMGQAEQLIHQLEAEKTIFTSDERNLIVNYAYKLDDMDKIRELAEKLAYQLEYSQQDVGLTIIDAQAEIDALPDPIIGLSEMREYGYTWNEMLPLTQEKSIIINRYQLILFLNTPFRSVMVWSGFQIIYDICQCFPNCHIQIIINTTVDLLIISSHNGIIIASIHLLDTDIAVCNLKGKFGFFPNLQGLFHICKHLFLFITKVNDFIPIFQRVVRSLQLLFLRL